MKRYALAARTAALIILLAACGSSSKPAQTSAAIVISNSIYSGSMTVKPGQRVTVTNKDPMTHALVSTKTLFSTGAIAAGGGTATFTAPTEAGSYPVHCLFHTAMQGTLIVQR